MRRHNVTSSVFKSVGYYMEEKILEVEFRESGEVWHYLNFPNMAYKKFVNAGSLGNFFTTRIKNKYEEVKIK